MLNLLRSQESDGDMEATRIITKSSKIQLNGACTRSLRSRDRIDNLLTSYKNSKLQRTCNLKKCSQNSFIMHKEPANLRINFINTCKSKSVNAKTLKCLMIISKRTDLLITKFSEEFLSERSIKYEKNIGENVEDTKLIVTLSHSLDEIEKLTCTFSKTCVTSEDNKENTQNLNVSSEMVDADEIINISSSDSVICLDSFPISNNCSKKELRISNLDCNKVFNVNLNESDLMFVKQYCALCGASCEDDDKANLKRKHHCNDGIDTKRRRGSSDYDNQIFGNINPLQSSLENIKNKAVENVNMKQTKEIGLSPIAFASTPKRHLEEDNKVETPTKLTVSCSIQTSTPTNSVETNEIACNTSNSNLTLLSNHNSTQSFINSPRMKKILDFLDRRYAYDINAVRNCNSSFCQSSAKPNLDTISEEGSKQNHLKVQTIKNNKPNAVTNRALVPKEIIDLDEIDNDFQPLCVDTRSINYIFGYNFYGSNVYRRTGLRLIVIDGSNVAFGHSNGKYFSTEGLRICIDYFFQRGHQVKAFVPQFRLKSRYSSNPRLLKRLYEQGHVVFTPSREVNGHIIASYDDRFIVQCAVIYDAVIVSNDCYRDLIRENPSWKQTIERNLLMVTWIDNVIIFPSDPLGRYGPTLEKFLRYT